MFKNFLEKMPARERYITLLKQYKYLIHLELPTASSYSVLTDMLVPLWITYNLREQLELLQLIILLTSQIEVTLDDVNELIELLQVWYFQKHFSFWRKKLYNFTS